MPPELTLAVANFVARTRYRDLPRESVHETKRALINIVGCMLGGVSHDMIAIMERALENFPRPPHATIIGRNTRKDVFSAASLNGASSSVRAYDDSFRLAVVHPSGSPAAASLAYAEWKGLSGQDLLLALALGIELICRLSQALATPPAESHLGWSQTGTTSGIGAAVSVAKLMGLEEDAIARAIGIAVSQACGNRASHGTMTTALLTAHGAEMGLRASLLAHEGFSAPINSLEHHYGFLSLFAKTANAEAVVHELGRRYMLMDNMYKRYPCAIVAQSILDACVSISRQTTLSAEMISGVRIETGSAAFKLANKPNPADHLHAQNSAQHWAVATLLRGKALLTDGSDEAVANPETAALRNLVSMTLNPAMPNDAARVTVTLRDGSEPSCYIESQSGAMARPMSDSALEEKFMDQTDGVLTSGHARKLLGLMWDLESYPDIAGLLAQFARPAGNNTGDRSHS